MPGSPQLSVNPDPGDLASSSALLISAPTHIYLHMDIPAYTELKQINLKKIKLPWNVRICNISLYSSNIHENNFVLK